MRAEETREREVRGCGNPNCPQCNPWKGEGDPMSSSDPSEEYKRLKSIMMEQLMYPPSFSSPESASDREYKETREKVEEFILEVPPQVAWENVHGNDVAKEALISAVEAPFTHAALYAHYGMTPPKGVLLWGPPGCGKTMFGKAAAAAVGKLHGKSAEMLCINGASLQSPWVGVTEALIENIFKYARLYKAKHGHSLVIFIDEADSILSSRESGIPYIVRNVSTFLAEMDGVRESGAFVILATNRPEDIDEAILRDGRIDRKIKVERPTLAAGTAIIVSALASAPLDTSIAWPTQGAAQFIMDYLVHPDRVITRLTAINNHGETQDVTLTLAHIMSGAMLVGLVARAKALAFARDLANGTITGIQPVDLTFAVDQIVAENAGLPHFYAARELQDQLNLREMAKTKRNLN